MYNQQYLNSPTASTCNYTNNFMGASGTTNPYTWTYTAKHCATSKCGKPCHIGLFCKVLKKTIGNLHRVYCSKCGKPCHIGLFCKVLKKTIGNLHRVYCSKCDITFESDLTSCEDKEIEMIEGVYP